MMDFNIKWLIPLFISVGVGFAIVILGDTNIIIEAGVMNFWSMVGALGAFVCSFILLIMKLIEKLQNRSEYP